MTSDKEGARAAVALACVAANAVTDARQGRSRRDLSKRMGLSSRTLAAIEEASVLPSTPQLKVLTDVLGPLPTEHFALAARFGAIPWVEAIAQTISDSGPMTARGLTQHIAAEVLECSENVVGWRLTRALERLEGSGRFQRDSEGLWSSVYPLKSSSGHLRSPARGKRVDLAWTDQRLPDLDAFFHADSSPGIHEVVLNQGHPIYPFLESALDTSDLHDASVESLIDRAEQSAYLLRVLLEAWVNFEDAEKIGTRRDNVREIRQAWGRSIKATLSTMKRGD